MQLRRVRSNVGALNPNLRVHTLVEVWAWGHPAEEVRDRSDRPWEDPSRRPSHADRRRALQRQTVEEEFRRIGLPPPWSEKNRPLVEGVVRMVARRRSLLATSRVNARPRSNRPR